MPIVMTSPRTVARTERLNLEVPIGFQFDSANSAGTTLTINGYAELNSPTGVVSLIAGVDVRQAGYRSTIDIGSTGQLIVRSVGSAYVYGLHDWGTGTRFSNAGVLEVSSTGFATGVYSFFSDLIFNNTGRVTVRASSIAKGVDVSNAGTVFNSGLIEVESAYQAIGVHIGSANPGRPLVTEFVNSGQIIARGIGDGQSIGVLTLQRGVPHVDRFVNTGLISAEIAFYVSEDADPDSRATLQSIINSGVIEGDVILGRGQDEVVNTGRMTGLVDLGDGQDLYDGRSGTEGALVFGNSGDDTLRGGYGDDSLHGGIGQDLILGGGGNDLIDGGGDGDVIDGGDGFDTLSYVTSNIRVVVDLNTGEGLGSGRDMIYSIENVVGSRFGDTIRGTGAEDVLEGREGGDYLHGREGEDVLVGGLGADTLVGGAGADTFIFSAGDGRDTISDFMAGGWGERLEIHGYSAYRELRQEGADTVVVLSDTDSIRLTNVTASSLVGADFLFNATALNTPASPTADPYLSILRNDFVVHAGELLVFNTVAWPISIIPERPLFEELSRPSVYNAGTILVRSPVSDQWAMGVHVNSSTPRYEGSVILNAAGGVIDVRATSATAWAYGVGGDFLHGEIFNAGRLAVSSRTTAYGVAANQAQLVNTGVVEVHAGASAWGLVGQNIYNSGDVYVYGGEQTWIGESYGISTDSALLTNTGRIVAREATADGHAYGVLVGRLSRDTVVLNSGLIDADYTVYEVGSAYSPGATKVYNTGELRGDVALFHGRSEVHNAGLITGVTALYDGDDLFDGRRGTQGEVRGERGADVLLGGVGDDRLDGGTDGDVLWGGGGADRLTGGQGNDVFGFAVGDGRDILTDFVVGQDVIHLSGYGAASVTQDGADTLITLSETDSLRLVGVSASTVSAGAFVFNAPPPAPGETFPSIAPAPITPSMPAPALPANGRLGTAGADTLTGAGLADRLFGQAGADRLDGGAGNDVLRGGDGDDTLLGGAGDDDLDGGAGTDVLIVSGARAGYVLLQDGDGFLLKGGEGVDRLSSIEEIRFSDGVVSLLDRFGADGWESLLKGGEDFGGPQVLPGVPGGKETGGPVVLPGPDPVADADPAGPEAKALLGLAARLAHQEGWMPVLDHAGGAVPSGDWGDWIG